MYPPLSAEYREQAIAKLESRRACIQRMTDALREFLSFDVEAQLELLRAQAAGPQCHLEHTPEMLIEAQAEVERVQEQLDQITTALEACDPDKKDLARAGMGPMVGMLQQQLRAAEKERNHIQEYLEKGAAEEGQAAA